MLLSGCGTGREAAPFPSSSSYITAHDGGFSYLVPQGWFDASVDSQARGHALLLIRNDYGATIAVDEVRLNEAARSELRQHGLLSAAQLLLSLTSWEQHAVLTTAPRIVDLGDRQGCRYSMVSGNAEDTLDVTVVETGGRLFAVNVLVSGKGAAGRGDVESVREMFLGAVRW